MASNIMQWWMWDEQSPFILTLLNSKLLCKHTNAQYTCSFNHACTYQPMATPTHTHPHLSTHVRLAVGLHCSEGRKEGNKGRRPADSGWSVALFILSTSLGNKHVSCVYTYIQCTYLQIQRQPTPIHAVHTCTYMLGLVKSHECATEKLANRPSQAGS